MSQNAITVPSKRLAEPIISTDSSFKVNNIRTWLGLIDGATDLVAADFGDRAYVVFRNESGTRMEIMKIDPATIASASITILLRGLAFTGSETEITANKLDWPANETVVEFGSHPPQLFENYVDKFSNESISGVKTFNSHPKIATYAAPTADEEYAPKKYVDDSTTSGAPDASTSTKGIVEEATQAEVDARTTTGGSGAKLFAPLDKIRASKYHDYAADGGANDTYAITVTPAPTAYAAGQVFQFKANTVNTGACTLNVNSLGAKSLKMNKDLDPVDGYIKAGQIVTVIYDGTNMQILSVSGKPAISIDGSEIYAADGGASDTYAVTLNPAPTAYSTGQVIRFKANTANTGAATINVNSLGAKTIKKYYNQDLDDNDILANQIVEAIYDGTNFQLLSINSSLINAATVRKNGVGTRSSGATGAQTIAHSLGKVPKMVRIKMASYGSSTVYQSDSVWNGTTIASLNNNFTWNGAFAASQSGSTTSVGTGLADVSISADATNITLTWNSISADNAYSWEAEA